MGKQSDELSVSKNLDEFCRNSSLQLPCQRRGIGSVPGPLTLLHEALPFALELAWQVDSQRGKASTQLRLRPLPVRDGSRRRFSFGYIVWGSIRVACVCIVLQLAEGAVLCCIVLS